jgi:hypothetical protein
MLIVLRWPLMVLTRIVPPSCLTKIIDAWGVPSGAMVTRTLEVGTLEDVADGLVEDRMAEMAHTCFDSRAGPKESLLTDSFPRQRESTW